MKRHPKWCSIRQIKSSSPSLNLFIFQSRNGAGVVCWFACAHDRGGGSTISYMGDSDAAQAVELIRALSDQLRSDDPTVCWGRRQDSAATCASTRAGCAQQGLAAGQSRAMRMAVLGPMCRR